jgi:hypothetical protein
VPAAAENAKRQRGLATPVTGTQTGVGARAGTVLVADPMLRGSIATGRRRDLSKAAQPSAIGRERAGKDGLQQAEPGDKPAGQAAFEGGYEE